MSRYQGLDAGLVVRVRSRDQHRCRWCGRTSVRTDLHHIRYRRGVADDVDGNIILLCRRCHEFVHGAANGKGETISKAVAQEILYDLIDIPGATGMALWRQRKAKWAQEGKCEHGVLEGECFTCERKVALA